MNRIRAWLERVRAFFGEVGEELKKCSWPTGVELRSSTVLVLTATAIVGLFVFASDTVLFVALKTLVR